MSDALPFLPPSMTNMGTSGISLSLSLSLSLSVCLCLSLSLFYTAISSGEPGLASLIVAKELRDNGSGGDNWSYKTCEAPVKLSPTNQHPVFLQAGCPSCCPTNNVKALKVRLHYSLSFLVKFSLVPVISAYRVYHIGE